jgi:uncharacterized membrane protein
MTLPIENDAIVLGILVMILAFVFQTEKMPRFQAFYNYVPSMLLCYFLPGILNTMGVISGETSKLYGVVSQYLLPASLILFGLSLDIPALRKLGKKAVGVFLGGVLGVMIGGPIALCIVGLLAPDILTGTGNQELWRGLATIAGTWIGGAANQAALKEIFGASDQLFSVMAVVDVIVAYTWMAILLYGVKKSAYLDARLKADTRVLEEIKQKIAEYQGRISRIPDTSDLILLLAIGLGGTGFAHLIAEIVVPFLKSNAPYLSQFSLISPTFWVVIVSTTIGILLSSSPHIRSLEGAGASKIASVFLYLLIATLGMKLDVSAIFVHPILFILGFVWISIHGLIIFLVAKWMKAPFFFVAVGSQAGIGGTASAPVVASAFHPSLAPVGVLLAILGFAVGTYGSVLCAYMMEAVFRWLQVI